MVKENQVSRDNRPKFVHVRGIGFSALIPLESYQNGLRELVESIYGKVRVKVVDIEEKI
ncbi:hypothetical protein [Pyrodictium abyssi]|uniref:Uncharacterized protein n=1 Tax=Pyrodictium abyssi TaxID=54256 RepID=A0ABN6ZUU1_9CREN|nr:hypothetical protein PABY_22850 [Pyrodictium abyssi]